MQLGDRQRRLSDRQQRGTRPPNNGLQRTALRPAAEAERLGTNALNPGVRVSVLKSLLFVGLVAGLALGCESTTEPPLAVDYCARVDSIRPTLSLSAPIGSPR